MDEQGEGDRVAVREGAGVVNAEEAVCPLCDRGFTEDEWNERHPDDLHRECCENHGPCSRTQGW